MTTPRNSAAVRRATNIAISAYGSRACVQAYKMNLVDGHGASTIGFTLGLTTRQADAAIRAGQNITLLAWEAGLTPIGLHEYLRTITL